MSSYYIPDYFRERDLDKATKVAQNQIKNYKVAFQGQQDIVNNIEKISEQYTALPTDVVVALAVNGVNPDYLSLGEIEDEVVNLKVKKEAELWTDLYEKYQPENMEKNMKMSVGDLFTAGLFPGGAKPGDVQYGVWAFAALDALFQTFGPSGKWSVLASAANALVPGQIMQVGRSQAYLRDIRYYDKLLQDGYTPEQAQSMLQTDVSWTEIENIGKDTNLIGDIRKHIDMIQEAHNLGGEPLLANMWRQVVNGKPVNFDRGTKATLESIDATNTPMFHDLTTKFGYSEEEAKKFIYNNIGEPIKQFDKDGEIHYTSAYNPNKINFYAGRSKQRYFFSGQTAQDYYKPDWAENNTLLEYSPGRVQASEIAQPGSVAFNTLSGVIDASYQIVPEIIAGKGLKGIKNVKKGFRGINKAFEATELGIVKKTGKTVKISPRAIADDIIETVGDEVDAVTGKGNFDKLVNYNTNDLVKYTDDVVANRKQARKAAKKLKKEYTVFGRVPKFFQTTKDEVLNQPVMNNFFEALAKTDESVSQALADNPIIGKLHPLVQEEILKETNPAVIKKMFGDMMDQGYTIKADVGADRLQTLDSISGGLLPVKGSNTINKLSQNLAATGTRLQQKGTRTERALGRIASTVGNENAAYRSFGSYVGTKGKQLKDYAFPGRKVTQLKPVTKNDTIIDTTQAAGEMIKKQKVIDELDPTYGKLEFEKYLGFSSSFNSSYNPYYRKLLGVVPYLGIPLNNFATGYKQLASHMQITGYDMSAASARLNEFRKLDFGDKKAIRDFTYNQMLEDVKLIKKRGGNDEIVADIVAKQFAGMRKSKIYATATNKETLPNVGSRNEIIQLTDPKDGNPKNIQHVTAQLFSEMSDNVIPLLDYRIVNRAMGKVFKAQPGGEALTGIRGFAYDVNQYKKFKFNQTDVNPFEKGIINTKQLNDDSATLLANYYTRNVFKPLVLLRAAFFTRVFLEEQARIAVSGLDGFFNHPFRYIQWLSAHNPKNPWFLSLRKLPGITKANTDGVELLASQEAMQAAQKTFLSSDFLTSAKYNRDVKGLEYIIKSKGPDTLIKDYTLGTFNELIMLRNDEISRNVAKFRYGSKELNDWIYSEKGFAARRSLYDWGGNDFKPILDDKDFIDQYLQSIEARIRIKTGGKVQKGTEYYKLANSQKYRYKIKNTDTGNANLRYAIAEGRLFDETFDLNNAATATRKDYLDFSEDPEKTIKFFKKNGVLDRLQKYVSDEGLDLDIGDVKLSKPMDDVQEGNILVRQLDALNDATDFLFEHLMTKPIGYLNRSVVFKQNRWLYIGNKFQYMSDGLRNKFIKEAIDAAVPKSVVDELKGLKKLYPSGAIDDYYTMNTESKAFGLSMTKQLLYDTTQKHALADKVTNIFPFAEVWFEVFSTWGKLLAENPTVLRKAQVTTRGFGGADSLGATSGDGFFTPAPGNSDEEMFVYPWGGFMTDVIFGDDTEGIGISPRGYVTGVNLLGQGFVPGPNPMVAFGINKVLPETPWADDVREKLFGTFAPPEKITDIVTISSSYKKLGAWMKSPESFEEINDSSSEIEKMRANATIDVFRYGMAAGVHNELYDAGKLDVHLDKLYPGQWSKDTITKKQISTAYLEYSKYASGDLFMFQFLFQFFGPTGMKPEYVLDDPNGNQWGSAVLYDEYVRIRNKNNNDYIATHNEFLQLYGFEHPWITSPRSQQTGPKEPFTSAAARWKKENKEIYDILPKGTANYLNLDNPYDERSFNELNVSRQQMSPSLYQRNTNDTIGFLRYKRYSEQVDNLDAPNNKKVLLKRFYRNLLIEELPGFQRDEQGVIAQSSSLDKYDEMKSVWVNKTDTGYSVNPILKDQEAAQGFAEMLPFWEEMESISKQLSPSQNPDWWLSSDNVKAKTMRIWMYNKAQQIIAEYPDFWGVWTGVMLKLYRDDQEYLDYLPES